MRRALIAGALAVVAGALLPGTASAELGVWADIGTNPRVEFIDRLFNQKLFNNNTYDVPFYRTTAGTRVLLYGEVLDDRAQPARGGKVFIYALKFGEKALKPLATVNLDSKGRFAFKTAKPTIQTAFVVFAVGGRKRDGKSTVAISNPVFTLVAPKLIVPRSVRATRSGLVVGRVTPRQKGKASIWLLNGKKARRISTKAVAKNGRFAFALSYSASGTYSYTVVFEPKAKKGYVPNGAEVTVRAQIPVPAPPPPPPSAPPTSVIPVTNPAPSNPGGGGGGGGTGGAFGGSCNAFGCTELARAQQLERIAGLLVAGAPIPIATLPKPAP